MVSSEVIDNLSYNERRLLLALEAAGGSSSPADMIAAGRFALEVEIMGSASWLSSKGLAEIKESSEKFYVLADAGILESGLPERKAIRAIDAAGGSMDMAALAVALPNGEDKIAVGWLKRKGLADIVKEGDAKILKLTQIGKDTLSKDMDDEALLKRMSSSPVPEKDADPKIIKDLKGRQGMIAEEIVTERTVVLTDEGKEALKSGIELKDEIVQMDDTVIQSGRWRDAEFRRYDVQTFAPAAYPAKKHPLSRLG